MVTFGVRFTILHMLLSSTPKMVSTIMLILLSLSLGISIVLFIRFLPDWISGNNGKPEPERLQPNREYADPRIIHADSTAVILTLGQSNAASSGQGTYHCRNEVYEFYQDSLFSALDPLLGDVGNGGCSVWTRLADMLIDSGQYRRVVLISLAVGSTTVQSWEEGTCSSILQERLEMISRHGINVTHMVWHQGESDNLENTSREVYKVRLKRVLERIRRAGVEAPFWVCVASYHPEMIGVKEQGLDTCIRRAQIEFVEETSGTRPGPDTDLLNLASDRYDGVHFSRTGLDKFALQLYRSMSR